MIKDILKKIIFWIHYLANISEGRQIFRNISQINAIELNSIIYHLVASIQTIKVMECLWNT